MFRSLRCDSNEKNATAILQIESVLWHRFRGHRAAPNLGSDVINKYENIMVCSNAAPFQGPRNGTRNGAAKCKEFFVLVQFYLFFVRPLARRMRGNLVSWDRVGRAFSQRSSAQEGVIISSRIERRWQASSEMTRARFKGATRWRHPDGSTNSAFRHSNLSCALGQRHAPLRMQRSSAPSYTPRK